MFACFRIDNWILIIDLNIDYWLLKIDYWEKEKEKKGSSVKVFACFRIDNWILIIDLNIDYWLLKIDYWEKEKEKKGSSVKVFACFRIDNWILIIEKFNSGLVDKWIAGLMASLRFAFGRSDYWLNGWKKEKNIHDFSFSINSGAFRLIFVKANPAYAAGRHFFTCLNHSL